ncbi:MAG: hypothetical protein WD995_08305 [Gemmatimonadota bacterium]
MTRLVLLGVLCVLTWYYFPESRAILSEAAAPALRSFDTWGALDEEKMQRVARNVVAHERLTGEIPEGEGAWQAWLGERYRSEDVARDRWGATFQLVVLPDSVAIVSYGPDGLPDTDDDLQVASPRG